MIANKTRFSVLVVLFNKEIVDSLTLTALKKYPYFLEKVHLTIWNNGPFALKEKGGGLVNLVNNITIHETLENKSLSMIYNVFLKENDSDYYVILDDDSLLSKSYIDALINLDTQHFVTPIIKANNKIISPSNLIKNSKEDRKNLRAIASGLVISKDLKSKVFSKYNSCFDERFYFYGVDTSFLYRLNRIDVVNTIIPGFDHKISEYIVENKIREDFKSKELSYSLGLKLRLYPTVRLYKRLLKIIIDKLFFKRNRIQLRYVLYTFFMKTHPRNISK